MHTNGTSVTQLSLDDIREAVALQVGDTAQWRLEKAKEYPDDRRNVIATGLLDKIEASIPEVAEDLLREYEEIWDKDGMRASELSSEVLRCVGFSSGIDTAQELLETILGCLRPHYSLPLK